MEFFFLLDDRDDGKIVRWHKIRAHVDKFLFEKEDEGMSMSIRGRKCYFQYVT